MKNEIRNHSRHNTVLTKALAHRTIEPPKHVSLSADERRMFDIVVGDFSRDEMTAFKLELIVMLTHTIVGIQAEQAAIEREGSILTTNRGPVSNPRNNILSQLIGTMIRLRTTLGLANYGPLKAFAAHRTRVRDIEDNALELFDGTNPTDSLLDLN